MKGTPVDKTPLEVDSGQDVVFLTVDADGVNEVNRDEFSEWLGTPILVDGYLPGHCAEHDTNACWRHSAEYLRRDAERVIRIAEREKVQKEYKLQRDLMRAKQTFFVILGEFDICVEQDLWRQACRTVVDYTSELILGEYDTGPRTARIGEAAQNCRDYAEWVMSRMPYQPPEVAKQEMWDVRKKLFFLGHMVTEPIKLREPQQVD